MFIILIMQLFLFPVNSILLCHMDSPATYCQSYILLRVADSNTYLVVSGYWLDIVSLVMRSCLLLRLCYWSPILSNLGVNNSQPSN